MRSRALALAAAVAALSPPARAACPVGLKISVDNDTPGSGYSEVKPENWVSHSVDACKGNYRYLSAYVGDGTRKGKATWQPKIATAGVYEVTTSYRASTNRTNDADYTLFGDDGKTLKKSVNQSAGNGCTKVVIGSAYCAVGGTCRLLLDGDDGKSDAADETVFVLTSCDVTADAGAPGPCDGIKAKGEYELCSESPSTCSGVYNDGSGCAAYCAAAGMVCTARFGAGPGCSKEPQSPFPCNANNGHLSNWCDCAYPPGSGGSGGGGGSGGSGGGSDASAGGAAGSAGALAGGGGSAGSGAGWSGTGASIGKVDAGPNAKGATVAADDGGCGCRTRAGRRSLAELTLLGALGLLAWRRRRRR